MGTKSSLLKSLLWLLGKTESIYSRFLEAKRFPNILQRKLIMKNDIGKKGSI